FYLVRALPVSHSMAPTAFYSLSLHDALPIFFGVVHLRCFAMQHFVGKTITAVQDIIAEYLTVNLSNHFVSIHVITVEHFAKGDRSEEHTSELQSRENLVCRLLLEKKKKKNIK